MPFEKGNRASVAGGLSRRGKPNKSTRDAREAIARFVDRNAPKLQRWLDAVANGLREGVLRDQAGNVILDDDGKPVPGRWIVAPDPEKAFQLFQSVIEYHVPKLSRREVVKDPAGPSRVIDSSKLTAEEREQMRQIILRQMQQPELLEQIAPNVLEPVGLAVAQVVESVVDNEHRTSVIDSAD